MACPSATEAAIASCDTWEGRVLRGAPPILERFCYRYLNTALAVATDDLCAARILRAAFSPILTKALARVDCMAAIERTGDRLRVCYEGAAVSTYSINGLGNFGAAFCAVRDIFIRYSRRIAPNGAVYGACGALAGNAFVLLGRTTIGKTLLMLHLAANGVQFLGDETFTIDGENPRIRAFPRLPSLREPAVPLLPSDELRCAVLAAPNYQQLPGGRLWFALEPSDLHGIAPSSRPHGLRTVFFLEGRGRSVTVEELSQNDMLTAFVRRIYHKPETLDRLLCVRAVLNGARGYRVQLGDPGPTAAALMRVLGRCV